ncbi:MAG: hypothetical protein ACOY3D_06890 [Candidatus Omnitrophota bacterium]
MSTFLDPDMAYLSGLIVGRGTIREASGTRQLVIDYPFRSLVAKGIKKSFDTKDKILLSLDDTINRLGELSEVAPRKVPLKNSVSIIIESTKNSLLWRNINKLLKGKTSFREMEVPEVIFEAEEEIKKEFLRGIADVTGSIGTGGRDQVDRHRVYISILNENWKLPIQICKLLQDEPLKIPVNTIDWGHPNIRNGHAKEYQEGREQAWAREHQLKVYAECFEPVGFRIIYKNEILKELAEYNRTHFVGRKAKLCMPEKKRQRQRGIHPEENSGKLPRELRGKHCDTYWQVCLKLGCKQFDREKALFSGKG